MVKKGAPMYQEELPLKERLTEFIYRVYGLMSFALFITAATAYYVYKTPVLAQNISGKPGLLFFLFIVQFMFVITLTIFLPRRG